MQDRRGKWCAIPRPRCPGVASCQVAQSPKVKADLAAALQWRVLFLRQIDTSRRLEMRRLIREVATHHKRRCAASFHRAEATHREELQQMAKECQSWQRKCEALEHQARALQGELASAKCKAPAPAGVHSTQVTAQHVQAGRPHASSTGAQVAAAVVHERMPKWAHMRGPKKKKYHGRKDEGDPDEDARTHRMVQSAVDRSFNKMIADLDVLQQRKQQRLSAATKPPEEKRPATLVEIKALVASSAASYRNPI